jgi:hypothetical protein
MRRTCHLMPIVWPPLWSGCAWQGKFGALLGRGSPTLYSETNGEHSNWRGAAGSRQFLAEKWQLMLKISNPVGKLWEAKWRPYSWSPVRHVRNAHPRVDCFPSPQRSRSSTAAFNQSNRLIQMFRSLYILTGLIGWTLLLGWRPRQSPVL